MANHPFSQETINRISDEILEDVFNEDLEDTLAEFSGSLVEFVIPYTKGTEDLHAEVSGAIMMKLAKYIKLGYKCSQECGM